MTAHNEVNGIPCHKDKYMMTDIVRNEFGFKGFYVSDWMDIERIYSLHHTSETLDDAFIESVNAGMDMHMHGPKFADAIIKAVKNGMIPESRIDEACSKILTAKFRLGLFENPYVDEKIKEKVVFNQTHQATALDAARNSIVLLKNNGLLPLKENKYKRIFITGPNADNETILGDWALQQPQDRIITIKEGFEKISEQKNFTLDYFDSGRIIGRTTDKAIETATSRAKKSDLAIIVVGENSLRFESETKTCGENTDRSEINLHGKQLKLIQEIKKTGVPVIVVLVNGRPISEPWIDENIPAVLEAWEPGSFGGQAIAEIIFGEVNPSGKLPITFPRSSGQISLYYNHKPSHFFHKYKFTDYTPLYSFGYGLSYTSFKLTNLEISKESISPDENFTVKVNVKNTGKITGQEVVQLYIRDNYSSVTRPVKELKAYKKIKLNPNTDEIVEFELTAQDLAFYNAEMQWGVEKGDFTIMIGNSSRDEDLQKVNLHVNTTKLLKY
jgi:beta-glucosidase